MPVVGRGRIEPASGQITYTGGSTPSTGSGIQTTQVGGQSTTTLRITGDIIGEGWPTINASLPFTGVIAGTYTLSTVVVDSKGRITYAISGVDGGSLAAGNGLALASGTLSLANTSVSPGTYTLSTVVIDAQGRVTSATSGTLTAVTSVSAGTGLTGGTITSTGTIGLNNTGVTLGTYTSPTLVIDAQGRISSAVNGTAPGGVPLSFVVFVQGAPLVNSTLIRFRVQEAFRLEFTPIQSVATAEVATTSGAVFEVYRNGTVIGSFTFGAIDQEATFAFVGSVDIDYAVNDVFMIKTATTDVTISNIGFTFVGTRI